MRRGAGPVVALGALVTLLLLAGGGTGARWASSSALTGTSMTTVAIVSPTLSCTDAGLGTITVRWDAVPGATAYRVHSGITGGTLTTVDAGTLDQVFTLASGLVSVEAVFGSPTWVSDPSSVLTYVATAGLLGSCS